MVACQNDQKFTQVKRGMHSDKVIALVGQPESKSPMFGVEWWSYTKQNKLIIMENDTVSVIKYDLKASQDSMKTLGDTIKQKLDSLSK